MGMTSLVSEPQGCSQEAPSGGSCGSALDGQAERMLAERHGGIGACFPPFHAQPGLRFSQGPHSIS